MQFLLLLLKGRGFQTGPNDGRDLGPVDPLQRILREWVQKLGSDGAMACVEAGDDQLGTKNTEPDGPTTLGERTPRLRI